MNDFKIQEILEANENARGDLQRLSSWEADFIDSIQTNWNDADEITDKMQDVLDRIHERLCP